MTARKSTAAFVPTRRSNLAVFVIACVVGLGTMSLLGHAQTENSRTTKKEHTMTQISATQHSSGQGADKDAIRPFTVSIPEEKLVDLRRRIAATQWPEKETVTDHSQGVPLAAMRAPGVCQRHY